MPQRAGNICSRTNGASAWATTEVDVFLEEQPRPLPGAAKDRQQIDRRQCKLSKSLGKPFGRGIAHQLPSGLRDDVAEVTVVGVVDLEARGHQDDARPRADRTCLQGNLRDGLPRTGDPFRDARRRMGRVGLQWRLGRSARVSKTFGRREYPQAKHLQHHTPSNGPPQARDQRIAQRLRRATAAGELRLRAERLFCIVADEHRDEDYIRLQLPHDSAKEQQFFDGAKPLHAGVDDTIGRRGAGFAGVQRTFELLGERRCKWHLHRQHQRVAENRNPSLVLAFRADLFVVSDASVVDGNVGIELRCGKPGAGARLQAVSDQRIAGEEPLKGRRRLRAAPLPQAGFENGPPHEEYGKEQQNVARAAAHLHCRCRAAAIRSIAASGSAG
jgi:hypothetical protein